MAKNINVNRGVVDPYYRYKMPKIMAKVEGKGNGIKTVIANMTEVAKALERPPTYPTKYFGCELGAQTNFDLKNDRYIVNGEHDANKLQDILDGFIRKFVLCSACENPETTLTVKKQSIHSKCKACGHSSLIDPKQKLSTFILKNPPPSETSEAENKEKHDGGSPVQDNNSNGDEILSSQIKTTDLIEDEDWVPEPVEETKLPSQIGKLIIDKDLDKPEGERLDMLHHFFSRAKEEGTINDGKAMVNEAERLEVKTKAPLLLAVVLFDSDVVNQIKTHCNVLLRFCRNDKKAQRYLLGGIEQLANDHKEILPKTAHVIKALYDNDICDEETILAWGSKASSKYSNVKKEVVKEMIKIAQPVLKWLEEAEEESDSDDSDVAFDDRARVIGSVANTTSAENGKGAPQSAVVKDENGEDVDIDDI